MPTRICITLCIHGIKSSKLLLQVNPITAAFYDSILMYGLALNETLNNNEDPKDGRALARKLINKTYYNGNDYRVDVNEFLWTSLTICLYGFDFLFPSGSVGLTGDILINENGDREADYTLNDMDPETGFMIPIATYYGARRVYEKLPGYEITWSGGRTEAPLDIPRCGFLNDVVECQEPGEQMYQLKQSCLSITNCITSQGRVKKQAVVSLPK